MARDLFTTTDTTRGQPNATPMEDTLDPINENTQYQPDSFASPVRTNRDITLNLQRPGDVDAQSDGLRRSDRKRLSSAADPFWGLRGGPSPRR